MRGDGTRIGVDRLLEGRHGILVAGILKRRDALIDQVLGILCEYAERTKEEQNRGTHNPIRLRMERVGATYLSNRRHARPR